MIEKELELRVKKAELTLKELIDSIQDKQVPIELFKQLIEAVYTNDFSKINDPVIKSRYLTSFEKVSKHFQNVIYQNVYKGATYNKLIGVLIRLYAVIDSIMVARRNITNLSMQNKDIVEDFLKSYGFDIFPVFDDNTNKDVARQIYYYLRRKGTPHIISVLLNRMGFLHYQINEYALTRKNDEWILAPEPIYVSEAARRWNFEMKDIPITELDDPLWWLNVDDLNEIFNVSKLSDDDATDSTPNENQLFICDTSSTSITLKNIGETLLKIKTNYYDYILDADTIVYKEELRDLYPNDCVTYEHTPNSNSFKVQWKVFDLYENILYFGEILDPK